MSVDQLIAKACRAIETGQPNLARIYMQKALADIRAAKPKPTAAETLADVISRAADGVQAFIDAFLAIAANTSTGAQSDFALAGPARSGGSSHGS